MARRRRSGGRRSGRRPSGSGRRLWATLAGLLLVAVVALTRGWDPEALEQLGTDPTATARGATGADATRSVDARDAGDAPAGIPAGAVAAEVDEVVDGDTVRVVLPDGEATVRLIGIDTPETRSPSRPVECYGAEATARTEDLLPPGTTVYLERDRSDTDRYDRLLRYVWVDAGASAVLVNEALVAGGFAIAREYPPDVRYADRLAAVEGTARDEGAGLWGACGGADTPLE
jgi:micrococcal nuclease